MTRNRAAPATRLLLAQCISLALATTAYAQSDTQAASRLDQLEHLVQQQSAQLDSLKQELDMQRQAVSDLQQTLAEERLSNLRGQGAPSAPAPTSVASDAWSAPGAAGLSWPSTSASAASSAPVAAASAPVAATSGAIAGGGANAARVGRAPPDINRPPQVAQIFDQPGVLTPRGHFTLEPSIQLDYSSNDRVALVGYTVIPAILIGLIDVRQVKTTTTIATLTGRYGFTNRFELEGKIPYVYINADTVSREIFTGSAVDRVFNASGSGIGDVELTARYQLNQGGPDKAYWVGWLRYKSRTGKDAFEVVTDCVTRCVQNATGTGLPLELPRGSGFDSLQPGVTWLFASDPVVFFGSFSYLYNFERDDVTRTVLSGAPEGFPQTTQESIGSIKAGDIIGMNVGLGLALNEKAAISIGYDHSMVGKLQQNGEDLPASVRLVLGTLLLGGSYRLTDKTSLNVSLGVGVTRDTPDVSLMVRLPISF